MQCLVTETYLYRRFNGHFLPGGFVQVSRDGELLLNLGTHVWPDLSRFARLASQSAMSSPAPQSCLFKYCGELLNQLAVIEIFPDLLARSGDDAVTQILIN